MKPRILLSASSSNENYINAVTKCGGIAHAEYLPKVDLNYDGLILCGGGDIHPEYYGEEIDGSANIDLQRDAAEFALAQAYIDAGKPVLGICRGHQLLNVYFGGTLYQDLENAREHASFAEHDLVHLVHASKDSLFEKLYGSEFTVNSWHHQAVKKVGEGLRATLMSYDGSVVEGIEHESLPVFAVQWHPERMCFEKQRTDTVDGSEVIRHFVRLCKK